MSSLPVLYHFPLSPYSARVRLSLAEKGIRWESRICNIVAMQNYEPEYVRMHPGAVVPLLVDGDRIVPESENILRYLEERWPDSPLVPNDPSVRAKVEHLAERARAFPMEEVHAAMANRLMVLMEANALAGRVRRLERLAAAHKDLADRYRSKAAHMEARRAESLTPRSKAEVLAFVETELDVLEDALAAGPFLAGNQYTLADLMWTVAVARLGTLGLSRVYTDPKRPRLITWWSRMKARPSFATADVWDRIRPLDVLPHVVRAKAPQIALALVSLSGAALAWWWFAR